ncbi:MAG TPA: hypothetical protein VGY32_11550 [Solirubrobacteraceae bacterium]|jgi:hypothetical protein|nr:hypothetical protein [Solirubrobacteraceae bacterium]
MPRRRGPLGYVPARRGTSPTEERRRTQRLVRELRKLEAVQTIGGAIRNLPPPDQAPPVEVGLEVFTREHIGELYTALRGLGNEKVKIMVRWENVAGQRHTTQLYSRGGVRASWIVANSLGHDDLFAFLLSQLDETKYKGQARRILSVTVEYAMWSAA